jgi:predicted DCC family thiol-disulfide oxidoreductase YuxK
MGQSETPEIDVSKTHESFRTYIVYDAQCPFCSRYVRLVRLRKSLGNVVLVNARDGGSVVEEVLQAGLDLDEGMVLKMGERLYHGADCINRLALLSTPSGVFNKINRLIFRSERASTVLYPILRAGRNLVLRCLGRSKIGY